MRHCFLLTYSILLEYVKEDDSRIAVNYNNIGVIFKKQQKFDEALEYFKRSLQIELSIPNYNPELLSVTCKNVDDIFHVQGQIDQALAYVQKGLGVALEHLPSNHSVVAVCYCSLASIYNGQGDDESALNAYEKCIEIKLVTLPPDDAELATLYMTIAGLQLILGRPDEAGINSRKALGICIKKFDEQDPQRVICQKAFDLIHDILPHTQ